MERDQPDRTEETVRPISPDDAKPADVDDAPEPDEGSGHVVEEKGEDGRD